MASEGGCIDPPIFIKRRRSGDADDITSKALLLLHCGGGELLWVLSGGGVRIGGCWMGAGVKIYGGEFVDAGWGRE